MAGTKEGAAKAAATRIGVELAEYLARREAGEAWCPGCRRWVSRSGFASASGRPSGRQSRCKVCRRAYRRRVDG